MEHVKSYQMESMEFLVQGSSPEPYRVTFRKDGNHLAADCTCAAGEIGQVCKHRISILMGNTHGIVSQNTAEVLVAVSWLRGSDVEEAMQEVQRAEAEVERAKKVVSAAKKSLAAIMRR